MELITIKLYHEQLIQEHNLSLDELPKDIVDSIISFNTLKAKLYGNTNDKELIEKLKSTSLIIADDIQHFIDNPVITPEEEPLALVWLMERMDERDWGYLPRWKKDDIIQQAKKMELRQNKSLRDVIATQKELIDVLENQISDLVLMSKIELGDDVIERIVTLKKQLKK
jgi:hypothetical protein